MKKRIRSVNLAIIACACLFVSVLGVSAYLDNSIVTLHIVESMPYIIGPFLCLRGNKFGYALTFASGVFWLCCGVFLTTFVRNGFEQLNILIMTSTLQRIDILIAVPAAIGTAGLAAFSMIGYFTLPTKNMKDAVSFILAFILITIFFLTIFKLFAPGYLEMFRGVFFWS